MKSRNMMIVIVTFLLLCIGVAFAADGTTEVSKSWTASFKKDINWQMLTDAGYLVVGSDDGLYGLNPKTGEVAWKIAEGKGVDEDFFEIIPGSQFAVITKKTGGLGMMMSMQLFIDVIEGKILWKTEDAGIKNALGQMFVEPANGVLLYGWKGSYGSPTTFFVDPLTGKKIWENKELFDDVPALFPIKPNAKIARTSIVGNQPPVYLEDGSFLVFMSEEGLRKVDSKTGNIIWKSKFKFKEVPAFRNGYGPIRITKDGKCALVPHDKALEMINLADGKPVWEKPVKLPGKVGQMEETSFGLVVRGAPGKDSRPFITVVDLKTQASPWKKPFKDLDGASNFVMQGDYIYLYADGSVFKISLADGSADEFVKKIKFKDDEIPSTLELYDNGVILISDQNMAKYDFTGKQVYQVYHKAPQSGLFAKIASTALIAAANAAAAGNAYSTAQATGTSQSYSLVTSNPIMSARFKASSNAGKFVTVLTKVEAGKQSGPGLVKVDKVEGKDVKSLVLGTKEPKYQYDDVENRLFFIKDDKTIECYAF